MGLSNEIARLIARTHLQLDYPSGDHRAGGELLSRALLEPPAEEPPEKPVEPEIEEPPWRLLGWRTMDGRILVAEHNAEGVEVQGLEDWLGADHISSSSKNRQPLPGKGPGDVLKLLGGLYPAFRWSLTYDVDVEAVAKNPTRLGDPVGYPNSRFTYLNPDGTIRYGLNNRDVFKGAWQHASDGYPPWYRWGRDAQTWIVGEVDERGYPATVIGPGRTYLEWFGAASFANLRFKGPSGSVAVFQVENPKAYDRNGVTLESHLNWPDDPEAVGGEWQGFRDLEFKNVWIDGGWDFTTDSGERSKWGMLTYELGRSARGLPGFRWYGGGIENVFEEHCAYHHNTRAQEPGHIAIHWRDLTLRRAGRTAFQDVNRVTEGPDGQGRIILERINIEDVCLQSGGGGSALTFAGNRHGVVHLKGVECVLGGNQDLHPRYQQNITGGFVSHAGRGSEGRPTTGFVLDGCRFQVGPYFVGEGSARRANLQVGNATFFRMRRTSVDQYGGAREAIRFDPATLNTVELGAECVVRGDVYWGGEKFGAKPAGPGKPQGPEGWQRFLDAARSGRLDTKNTKVRILD